MTLQADFARDLASDLSLVYEVVEEALAASRVADWGKSHVFRFRLGLTEAIVNAIRHGNGNSPEKIVHLSLRRQPRSVQIVIRDEGSGFDPGTLPDPTDTERLGIGHGRGVFLMNNLCDEVSFNPSGNEVTLTLLLDRRK